MSFATPFVGQFRPYNGNWIHIQLTTTASTSGTYQIAVERLDCRQDGSCYGTFVGTYGNCPYVGFCGLAWPINLQGKQYAFYFYKGFDGVVVSSNSVQMWSTD
jgi:hypothetical protein